MDVNELRSMVTVLSLTAFVGIMAWVFWPRRRVELEAAASMALQDDPVSNPDAHPGRSPLGARNG